MYVVNLLPICDLHSFTIENKNTKNFRQAKGKLNMPRYVSEEILNKTRCPFSFRCLDEENMDMCEVDICLQGNTSFLKRKTLNGCVYEREAAQSYLCICPTRAELYKRNRI